MAARTCNEVGFGVVGSYSSDTRVQDAETTALLGHVSGKHSTMQCAARSPPCNVRRAVCATRRNTRKDKYNHVHSTQACAKHCEEGERGQVYRRVGQQIK